MHRNAPELGFVHFFGHLSGTGGTRRKRVSALNPGNAGMLRDGASEGHCDDHHRRTIVRVSGAYLGTSAVNKYSLINQLTAKSSIMTTTACLV
jgi:hypothetical protein